MLQKTEAKPIIRYVDDVIFYFNKLTEILINQNYFSFSDSAEQYVSEMMDYVEKNIHHLPKYPAPQYFSKYGKCMQYVTYSPNKRTTWYFFFLQYSNIYFIRYVTNNHFEGQYIR